MLYSVQIFSRGVAARMAGLDRHAFDQTLCARRIPSYDEERWAEDLETIRALRLEVERLKGELARARRDQHERPPHWEA